MLLNLSGVANPHDKSVLWGFISRHMPELNAENSPFLDRLAGYAVTYYNDFIKPAKLYRAPDENERKGIQDLHDYLLSAPQHLTAEDIQNEVYAIGKKYPFEDLKAWFRGLYEVLLGQTTGPRMGSFVALYGRAETATLLERALKGENLHDAA